MLTDEQIQNKVERRFKELNKAFFKQAGLCYWCDCPMVHPDEIPLPPIGAKVKMGSLTATREHLIPRSKGGGGGINIVAAHYSCNIKRGVEDTLSEKIIRHRKLHYLRDVGLIKASGSDRGEQNNFGRDFDGNKTIWAPQIGVY